MNISRQGRYTVPGVTAINGNVNTTTLTGKLGDRAGTGNWRIFL